MKELSKSFEDLKVIQIPRSKNIRADALSHLATSNFFELNPNILIDILENFNIEALPIAQIEHESSWIDPLMKYIAEEILLTDLVEAKRIKRQTP